MCGGGKGMVEEEVGRKDERGISRGTYFTCGDGASEAYRLVRRGIPERGGTWEDKRGDAGRGGSEKCRRKTELRRGTGRTGGG